MIKVKNQRKTGGNLFHYAHFVCDCLFPEVMNDIFKYKRVIREKNLFQSLGNFSKIYSDVMVVKHHEAVQQRFNNLKKRMIIYKTKERYCNPACFDKFRKYIFSRYKIKHLEYNNNYPKVLLIKRGTRIDLIADPQLAKINTNITTGKERREINEIDKVESYLLNKYKDNFKALYFENIPFEEQVLYFNNAKLIVCAHGAVMSNMFFCKKRTTILEITCNAKWKFFDTITRILRLNNIKCNDNNYEKIINYIDNINITI